MLMIVANDISIKQDNRLRRIVTRRSILARIMLYNKYGRKFAVFTR